jgi:hypothetical protein
MKLTGFEVSYTGAGSSGKGKKRPVTIRGRIARRSTPKSCQQWRESHFSLHTHSLAEVVGVFYLTIIGRLREVLGTINFHLP